MHDAAVRMDRQYRWQRHVYDLTRLPYLLGRDQLVAQLQPPAGARILEIGCGTGRNLIRVARKFNEVECFGLDVSSVMLETARRSIAGAGLERRITLAQADAATFDPQRLFGHPAFDRIMISYALSMIGSWRRVLGHAADLLGPDGVLGVVDFGDQAALPGWFRAGLFRWLDWFHVEPRVDLQREVETLADAAGLDLRFRRIYGGYAFMALLERRMARMPPI
jgi:S-adenosylmethionine-diacylgycerolhomoserine-N-methlytransferase